MIKVISISRGVPTIYMPLFVVLAVTALKDYIEDYKRKTSDSRENMSKCQKWDKDAQ